MSFHSRFAAVTLTALALTSQAQAARLLFDCRDGGDNAYFVSAQIFETQVRVTLRSSPRAKPFLDQVFDSKHDAMPDGGHLFTATSEDLQIQVHPEEMGTLFEKPYFFANIQGSAVHAGHGEPSHLVRCSK